MASSLKVSLMRYKNWLYRGNVIYPVDRLRVITFVACTALVIIGGVLHFLGILGIMKPVLLAISFSWSVIDATLLVLFLTHCMNIRIAFVVSAISSQAVESIRLLYLASTHTISSQQFYINELICVSILLLTMITFFYKTATIMSLGNMATIIICRAFIPDIVNSMTISFFILLHIALLSYCYASVSFVKNLSTENTMVKSKYNSFLSFMRMSDEEATSLIQLVRTGFKDEKHVDMLVENLSDETRANLLKIANSINNSKVAREEQIKKYLPMLSPTELTVCHLVMTGQTQKEIARIMDKTENNISTVRGNIRRKLSLESTQDLRTYLLETIKE